MFKKEYRHVGNELKLISVVTKTKWANWTEDEKNILSRNYPGKSMKCLSKMLGRSERSIEAQLKRLNIFKYPNWHEEDIEYLKLNYFRLSIAQLSVVLNKSKNAVKIKKHRLCLKSPSV